MQKQLFPLCFGSALLLVQAHGFAQSKATQGAPPPPSTPAFLKLISPGELKGDLSFLASDALAGRFTPSPGLEVAAEFIASKFRAFGLEPGGSQGYFQVAHMVDRRLPLIESALTIKTGANTVTIHAPKAYRVDVAASFDQSPVIAFPKPDLAALQKMEVHGKAVAQLAPDFKKLPHDQARAAYRALQGFSRAADRGGAALEIVISPSDLPVSAARLLSTDEARQHHTPVLLVSDPLATHWFEQASLAGAPESNVTVNIPAPVDNEVTVKNVIGILRGADPGLKNTCVLLSAHYDHIGTVETGRGMSPSTPPADTTDRIYNGANDDGSGTVSVVEIARALTAARPRPRRSIVFMTFFGEERGELGSQFYIAHPVFPVNKTVADLNLEQVGRTDSTTGPQINTASLTGYDYSNITSYVEQAGRLTGVKIYKDNQASDAYFTQSDNWPLAEAGIPAHSLTVAFDYPDYHGLGDEWQKIDYDNMARVDRMVALALFRLANSAKAPGWNAANPKTEPFRRAQAGETKP